jgi:hypothetical protein
VWPFGTGSGLVEQPRSVVAVRSEKDALPSDLMQPFVVYTSGLCPSGGVQTPWCKKESQESSLWITGATHLFHTTNRNMTLLPVIASVAAVYTTDVAAKPNVVIFFADVSSLYLVRACPFVRCALVRCCYCCEHLSSCLGTTHQQPNCAALVHM